MPSHVPGHVYHWKHGWIPLTHFAALQKAHGSQVGAVRYLAASSGIHGSHSPGEYSLGRFHRSDAAMATRHAMADRGVGLGSVIYWQHPATGKQVKAKIVGVEHTGHIIVQHSGNRNALIGHSTWSTTPHPNVPFANGEFRNPHLHTRPVEFENGHPVDVPPGIDKHAAGKFSTALPETFTKLDTSPRTVPGTHEPWRHVNVQHAYSMGPHKVIISARMNESQRAGLLADIKDTLHAAHPTIGDNPVTFYVPSGDRTFRTTRSGTVMGYVVVGEKTVHIHPGVAKGTYDASASAQRGFFMPAAKGVSTRKYVLTHELGHVVSNIYDRKDVGTVWADIDKSKPLHHGGLSQYAHANMHEAYAEAFAHHTLAGSGHASADTYAQKFGWKINRKKATAA